MAGGQPSAAVIGSGSRDQPIAAPALPAQDHMAASSPFTQDLNRVRVAHQGKTTL
jgi:hypothetical protein